jgi:peptidoglycan/xylan/chitin deacetylase (PgdA/CDA1 family)
LLAFEHPSSRREAILALMYHDVTADPETSGFAGPEAAHYKLAPERFLRHLSAMAGLGLIPGVVTEGLARDEVRLLLTFDDGGESCARVIAPALAELGWRAHFFVVTKLIDTPGFLTAAEVRHLSGCGHVVGTHGHSHRALTTLSDGEIDSELRQSRSVLEQLLDRPVTALAVPGGYYTMRLDRLAAAAGYAHVFTSEPWLDPRRRSGIVVYGRFAVYSRTSAHEIARLCKLSRTLVLRRRTSWVVRKHARAALGPVYANARSAVLRRRARSRNRG